LFEGRHFHRRRWVGWGLIALFVSLPLIPVGGAPAVLLDVPARKFHLFGATFLATDGVLLMLLMLALFVAVFLVTSVLGRVWCGWGCPQTVYLEFVFRPIERWLEGNPNEQRKLDKYGPNAKRFLKFAIYAVLSVVLANVFLSYFVGVERLTRWMTRSPVEHPSGFLIVFGVSALVMFDFTYFREQMCTVVCPYARLQSVLLDPRSLIVGYDARRGEPRGGGSQRGGDCIDCKACVITCPTGIDIRNGLQLECIGCTQCVDACDKMMDKVGKPRGLIAYTTQDKLNGKAPQRGLRPRVVIYSGVLGVLVLGLFFFGSGHTAPEVMVLRGIGAPYVEQGAMIRNQLRVKLSNRSSTAANYRISLGGAPGSELIAPENPVRVEAGEQTTVGAFVLVPRETLGNGIKRIEVIIEDEHGFRRAVPYTLLGPDNEDT
jgi:cytochrome c oxidase accessory protein FixG